MAGKVWMITGASRGFGAEIAQAVLAGGGQVVATARKVTGLSNLADSGNVLKVAMDVTDEAQVNAGVDAALTHFGRIDVLVNNAGYGLLGAIEEGSAREVENLFRTNVFGLLSVTRAVLPAMRKQRSGHIFNMSSVAGYSSGPGWGLYCSSKFAVEAITDALHGEVAPLGIHVTAIEPGYFRTDFLDSSSLVSTAQGISDYVETVGKMREAAASRNHGQPGDPKKLVHVLLRLAEEPEPPVHLPLGTDALARRRDKLAEIARETEQWREVSASTDFVAAKETSA